MLVHHSKIQEAPGLLSPRPEGRALSVLYLSFTGQAERPYLDPSTRYRCFYAVEAARSLGHRAYVATQHALPSLDASLFDMVVVHRPSFTPQLLQFVRAARDAGVRLIADYDDLIFDPAYATASSMFIRSWDTSAVMRIFERNTDGLRLFNEFTVSTAPLQAHVHALHPLARVRVVPNSVPATLWSMIADRRYDERRHRPYVGYFPGTATHDGDFSVAAESLARFCRARRVPLRVVGPVKMDDSMFRGVDLDRLQLQPFESMFDAVAACRVVVAPLAPSSFNKAKSHIKALEAVLSCAACVASDIPDMAQHRLTQPMSLVDETADWPEALAERWDCFDLDAAAQARSSMVSRFGSNQVYAPLFADQR